MADVKELTGRALDKNFVEGEKSAVVIPDDGSESIRVPCSCLFHAK